MTLRLLQIIPAPAGLRAWTVDFDRGAGIPHPVVALALAEDSSQSDHPFMVHMVEHPDPDIGAVPVEEWAGRDLGALLGVGIGEEMTSAMVARLGIAMGTTAPDEVAR